MLGGPKSRIDSGPPPSALESFPAIDPGSGCVATNGVSQPYDGMVECVCIYKQVDIFDIL